MAWLSVSSLVRFGEVGLLVVLVAFGFADRQGHGQGQATQELFQVAGVLAGGIDADVEVRLRMLLVQMLQALLKSLIAGLVFQDGEGLGGGLTIGPEEPDAMAVACGVNADADTVQDSGVGHGAPPQTKDAVTGKRLQTCVDERAARILRKSFGAEILVISGQCRMMYQSLEPKAGGNNLF